MFPLTTLAPATPVAIPYLQQEGILPEHPLPGQYSSHTYAEDTHNGTEEEITYTQHCVVWSQGGVVTRIFRFDRDDGHVDHAVLTWFPTDDGLEGKSSSTQGGAGDVRPPKSTRDRALVVLLARRAHIYLARGPSHTVNLPFDIERIFPTPRGIILQRKSSTPLPLPPTPLLPQPPYNSFRSSQLQQPSPNAQFRSSVHLNVPSRSKAHVPLRLDDFIVSPQPAPVDTLPSLFTLTDPLVEIGLVGISTIHADHNLHTSTASVHDRSSLFPEHEELLYFSATDERPKRPDDHDDHLLIAVTVNNLKRLYTVWQASFASLKLPPKVQKPRKSGISPLPRSRRRSTIGHRLSTGATTPVQNPRSKRESGTRVISTAGAAVDDLAETLEALDGASEDSATPAVEQPFERATRKSRNDRRTSSMMARAELSSQDQNAFAELARNPGATHPNFRGTTRPSQSFGAAGDRTSFGKTRLSGRTSFPGDAVHLSDVDEMTTIADSVGDDLDLHDLDFHATSDLSFDGFKTELVISRVSSIPFTEAYSEGLLALPPPCQDMKAFIASDASSASLDPDKQRTLAIVIVYRTINIMAEVECSFPALSPGQRPGSARGSSLQFAKAQPRVRTYRDIKDAIRLCDGDVARTVCLERSAESPQSSLNILLDTLQKSNEPPKSRYIALNSIITIPAGSIFVNPTTFGRFSTVDHTGHINTFHLSLQPTSNRVSVLLRVSQHIINTTGLSGVPLHSLWLFYRFNAPKEQLINPPTEWQAMVMTLLTLVIHVTGSTGSIQKIEYAKNKELPSSLASQLPCDRTHYLPAWSSSESTEASPYLSPRNDSVIARCAASVIECWTESMDVKTIFGSQNPQSANVSPRSFLMCLIAGLHIFNEEEHLDILHSPASNTSPTLTEVIDRLCEWSGWSTWMDSMPFAGSVVSVEQPLYQPRRLLQWIEAANQSPRDCDSTLPLFETTRKSPAAMAEKHLLLQMQNSLTTFTPRIAGIVGFFVDSFASVNKKPQPLETMVKFGIHTKMLETLPESIASPLRSRIRRAQFLPASGSSSIIEDLIGRPDLMRLVDNQSPLTNMRDMDSAVERSDVVSISQGVLKLTETQNRPAGHRKSALTDSAKTMSLIYRSDRRWAEASKLLNPLRVAVAAILPKPGCSETEFLDEQKNLAQLIYKRTMAIPSGSAILHFNSHRPMLTEKIEIYPFNTTCNMQPSNNTVNADKSNFTEEKVSWAFFHAGVNAGLRIRSDAQRIDTSWLVLNRPAELGNRHAGLLFALGLNGHLKSMAKWLAFKYLTPKHNMTSIGLLLGLAASHMGTMDSLVTRLLSVHVTRLLPPGAAELNLSSLTQTAGILGVGLLYYNSQHRRMSEVMLSELESVGEDGSPDSPGAFRDEGYRLAAGISLGLINLGRGRDARTLHDMRLIERLSAVAKGSRNIELIHVLDQATAGATIAIALIFMKSHHKRLAGEIGIPMNVKQFDYIRPDILLLRTVASSLIMWDDIEPELEWINSRVPVEYRGQDAKDTLARILANQPLESSRLPIYNILSGLCWSIALKHAGLVSGSDEALSILLDFFDMVTRVLELVHPGVLTYDELLTRDAMLRFQHLLALSMATVVAGSGNLEVLRRLRYLHGTIQADQTFGLHQAGHMAIGILFLGQGRYTLSTSDLAIASLMCAFYPLFPKDVLDNRAHLQALRHFWVFAAEPRCLLLLDLDTRQPVTASIEVHMSDRTNKQMEAPCLLPPFEMIASLRVYSADHWPVELNFADNPTHLSAFRKHQTIVLRRKDQLARQPTPFDAAISVVSHIDNRRQRGGTLPGQSRVLGDNALDWIFKVGSLEAAGISHAHMQLGLLGSRRSDAQDARDEDREALVQTLLEAKTGPVDDALILAGDAERGTDVYRLTGLKILLDWSEREKESRQSGSERGLQDGWIRPEWVDALKRLVAERLLRETGSHGLRLDNASEDVMDIT
ncbi:hypothetical protein FH972_025541 [Carpinus fangiana]|uniref:Anaphase-promoting complex subunit 1 N-terminal domain-containing protein n=1 Tax=Carpinus fangiana TaxID=176857 RepID=A0A5N6L1A9_9ROSI|nr:hypothetical protein FH972_025541 [Carpinus fangiana]